MAERSDLPPLWVLRHGETTWNAQNRLQGRLDSPLTPLGVAQAEAQGRILRAADIPVDATVRVSPAGRARRTADIALAGLCWPVTVDPDLVEVGLGDWQGSTRDAIRVAHPGIDFESDRHMWKFRGPGCEPLSHMVTRVGRVLRGLSGPTVIVTHGVTSRVLRALALGMAPERLSDLPGGQGVVHHVADGRARLLCLESEKARQQKGD